MAIVHFHLAQRAKLLVMTMEEVLSVVAAAVAVAVELSHHDLVRRLHVMMVVLALAVVAVEHFHHALARLHMMMEEALSVAAVAVAAGRSRRDLVHHLPVTMVALALAAVEVVTEAVEPFPHVLGHRKTEATANGLSRLVLAFPRVTMVRVASHHVTMARRAPRDLGLFPPVLRRPPMRCRCHRERWAGQAENKRVASVSSLLLL